MVTICRFMALVLLAIVAFATLSPIQLRPHIADANVERALAYVLLGLCLGLGFPTRLVQALVFVAAVAGVLEVLQFMDPSRHARISDAVLKALAGIIGVAIGRLVFVLASRWTRG